MFATEFARDPPILSARKPPERQCDPIGIQSVHFSIQDAGWCPLSGSCDCLLSVPSPVHSRAEEEHLLLGRVLEEICTCRVDRRSLPDTDKPIQDK